VRELEDRTLLNGTPFTNLFNDLPTLLSGKGLMNQVNQQILGFINSNNGNNYSLPLIGQVLNDPNSPAQFLSALGNNWANNKTPNDPNFNFQNALENAPDSATAAAAMTEFFKDQGLTVSYGQKIHETDSNGVPTDVEFEYVVGQSIPAFTANLDSALGLPNLGLTTSGQVNVNLSYTVDLRFGADQTGAYLDTHLADPSPQQPHVLSMGLDVTIPNFTAMGALGPLSINLFDAHLPQPWTVPNPAPSPSEVKIGFDLDLNDVGRVYVNQLANLVGNASVEAGADAAINLGIELSLGNFVSAATDFHFDWQFTLGQHPPAPTVQFNDVQVDIGSFFTSFVSPIISDLQQVTKPLQPVINALENPLPVVSDLNEIIHPGQPVTLAGLLNNDTLNAFLADANFINSFNFTAPQGDATIDLGNFAPANVNILSQALGDGTVNPAQLATSVVDQLTNAGDSAGAISFQGLESQQDPANDGPLFQFPVLEDPTQLFNLLLGKNVDFFDCHLINNQDWPLTNFSKFYSILGPLGVQINGSGDFKANFEFGFDSWGITHGQPLEGFFIQNASATLSASLDAGPAINIVVAQVDVTGGVHGTATLSLNTQGYNESGDGRIRPADIVNDISNFGVLGFLQLSGKVDAFLKFHASIGVAPFAASYDKVLADVVILDFDYADTKQGDPPPVLAGAGTAQATSIPGDYTFNGGAGGQLILNMGPYATYRGGKNNTDGDEDFSVTLIKTTSTNPLVQTVEVSAFGFQQTYEGVTLILAEGGLGNNTITIDKQVTVPVQLYASVDANDSNFPGFDVAEQTFMTNPDFQKSRNVLQAGGGDAKLVGGQGVGSIVAYYIDPSHPVYAGDLLVGGSGKNKIQGGDAQAGTMNSEDLVGGTDKTSLNSITAGSGGDNTLIAGPNGDVLQGAASGSDAFVAGAGNDTVTGGGGSNLYEWLENGATATDGNTSITGGPVGSTNTLQLAGTTAGDEFLATAQGATLSVQAPGGHTVQATGIQTLSLDDGSGGASYEVDNLAGTGVQQVNLNLHEVANADPPQAADQIVLRGSPTQANTVDISANPNVLAGNSYTYDSQGNPIQGPPVYGQATNVDLKIAGDAFGDVGAAHYVVTAAIPKPTDSLSVYTGEANDTVSVESTQGAASVNDDPGGGAVFPSGSVFVYTVGGDNTINVGTNMPATGRGLMDRVQGPLYIDAGTGTKNVLNLDESNAINGDTLALTATQGNNNGPLVYQLLRYQGESLASNPEGGGAGGQPNEANRYPMLIQYGVEPGGAFGGGINLYLPQVSTQTPNTLYVTDTMAGAMTTVYTDGHLFNLTPQNTDQVIVGYNPLDANNPANTPGTSMLSNTPGTQDNLLGPLGIEGSDWLHNPVGGVDLSVYDEAGGANLSYVLTANQVMRTGVPAITYNDLGISGSPGSVSLFAANADNTIAVQGTAAYTPATVNTGTANSIVQVGFLVLPQPPLYVLDTIQGQLTVNGRGGTDQLILHDGGNALSYTYDLSATELQRVGALAIAPIDFTQMTTVDLYEANQPANLTDSTNVSGTAQGTTTTVHTGDGNDGLTVSTLDNIQGPLDFTWVAGAKNLIADDVGAAAADTYTLKPFELDRTGAAPIKFNHLASLDLFTSFTQDAGIDVAGIDTGTVVSIIAGTGTTTVTAASAGHDLTALLGSLSVQGGGNTSLVVEDQNAATARSYTLSAGELQTASVPPQPPPIGNVFFANVVSVQLDAGALGNQIAVTGTAPGTHVTVNAGTNDIITVADGANSLASIQGRLDLVGTGAHDQAFLVDAGGTPMTGYTLTATELDHAPAPIGYQNLAGLSLSGSPGGDVFAVQSLPAATAVTLLGNGGGNTIIGPNTGNTWLVTSAGTVLDQTLTFSDMQNLVGGSGTDTLNFSQFPVPASTTLTGDGTVDGVAGSVPGVFSSFDNMDVLVGNAGAAIDGSNYQGSFNHKLTVKKYDTITLKVGVDVNGQLYAFLDGSQNQTGSLIDVAGSVTATGVIQVQFDNPGAYNAIAVNVGVDFDGTLYGWLNGVAHPSASINVAGSVGTGSVMKVNFLDSITVGNNMDGLLKGFGLVNGQVDTVDPTIGSITIGGTFGPDGQIIAPVLSQAIINQYAGHIQETEPSQDMQLLDITGSLAATGTVQAGIIAQMIVGQDLAGQVTVSGAVGTLEVDGTLSGQVSADSIAALLLGGDFTGVVNVNKDIATGQTSGKRGHQPFHFVGHISAQSVGILAVNQVSGPLLLDISQNGVDRKLVDSLVNPAAGSGGPQAVFSYVYDGTTPVPQVSVRVAPAPQHPPSPSYWVDLSLLAPVGGRFDLARLDCVTATGGPAFADLHDVAVEGNLLNTMSPAAQAFFGLAAGTPGGVYLPLDNLGSVAADGNVNAGTVAAHSIQAVAFGTATLADGTVVPAGTVTAVTAAALLAAGTTPAQSSGTFLVPFFPALQSQAEPGRPVALFMDTQPTLRVFDSRDVLFTDEVNLTPQLPPDPCVAFVITKHPATVVGPSSVQSISLVGDGGSISTALPIAKSITSTGPLGDLTLTSSGGLTANVKAASIFGSILVPNGSISGTIQTTGVRIDPVTGTTMPVAADIGRTLTHTAGNVTGVTEILAGVGGIRGRVISRGNLVSQVVCVGNLSGVIAAQGDMGAILRNADGTAVVDSQGRLTRFGGVVVAGNFSGRMLSLGNVFGDIIVSGRWTGRCAALGRAVAGLDPTRTGILGNLTVLSPLTSTGAIVSGGMIGDVAGGTALLVQGSFRGIVAAVGNVNLSSLDSGLPTLAAFYGANLGSPNAAVIDSLFQSSFDVAPGDLKQLTLMLAALSALHVGSDGNLAL
jgi:hypothetical protein